MTLLSDQITAIPDVTADERAARLTQAGTAWNERIAADANNAALTYKVTGRGVGSVGTEIRESSSASMSRGAPGSTTCA